MSLVRRVLVGVGCSFLCGQLYAQSPNLRVAGKAELRSSSSGQVTDGTLLYNSPGSTADAILKDMASRASVIFAGTVTAVKRGAEEDLRGNAATSMVEIDFAVDRAVRGSTPGSMYVMREWAGLWRDSPRFVVGQRLLMLLHAAGPAGLTSPVDGLDGAIPIRATTSTAGSSPSTPTTVQADGAPPGRPR